MGRGLKSALSRIVVAFVFAAAVLMTAKASANAALNISSTKFEFKDSFGQTKEFDGGNGNVKVLIFGGVSTCLNTQNTIATADSYIDAIVDKDADFYVINITSTEDPTIVDFMTKNGYSDKLIVGNKKNDANLTRLYANCYSERNLGTKMPFVYIFGKDGELLDCFSGNTAYKKLIPAIESAGVKIDKLGGSGSLTDYEMEVTYGQTVSRQQLAMINEFRTGDKSWYWNEDNSTQTFVTGLTELVYDYNLEKVAMLRAAEIAYFYSHTRPSGFSSFSAYDGIYTSTAKGENIAYGYTTTEDVFVAWREDDEGYDGQGHRRNMLNEHFTTFATGHVYYNGIHFWVQLFGNKKENTDASVALDSKKTVTISTSSGIKQNDYRSMGGYYGNVDELEHTWKETGIKVVRSEESEYGSCLVVRYYECINCGDTSYKTSSGSHDFDEEVIKAPTCGEEGKSKKTCKNCGYSGTRDTQPTGEHNYDEGVITTEPNCMWTGIKTYTCKDCGFEKDEVLLEGDHSYGDAFVAQNASCKEEGIKRCYCLVCGDHKDEAIPKTDHSYNSGVVTKKATTTAKGTKTYTCKTCGNTKTESIAKLIALKSVKLSVSSVTYTGSYIKPTVKVTDANGKTVSSNYYKVSIKNNKSVGLATVTVTGTGKYGGSVKATFKINPKGTTISSLKAYSKKFSVSWKKNTTQTTGYQIQYSTSSKFTKSTTTTVTVSKNTTVSKAISKLKSKKKYYVRVRTYRTVNGKDYVSDWSKYSTVTTK